MKKRLFKILAAMIALALMFTGCAKKTDPSPKEKKTEAKPASGQGKASAGEALQVRLQDDYYDNINGIMLSKVKIPGDASGWSQFYKLDREAYDRLNEVLHESVRNRKNEAEGSLEQKIADLYLTGMDREGRQAAGFGGLAVYMDGISNANTVEEYLKQAGKIYKDLGVGSILLPQWSEDIGNSSRYALYFDGADLGPGKETLEDIDQEELMSHYRAYISKIMGVLGLKKEEADQVSSDILKLQKDLAGSALPLSKQGDPGVIYNPYSKDQIKKLFPDGTMEVFLKAAGMEKQDTYIVVQKDQMKKISGYFNSESLPLLKQYTLFCLVNDFAPSLTPEIRDSYLEWNQLKKGIKEKKTEEKLASELTQKILGFEFGRLYVEKCFSKSDKKDIESMIHLILNSYKKQIENLGWMSDETKASAIRKLDHMNLKVGYPDKWPDDYKDAKVTAVEEGGNLIDNVLSLQKAQIAVNRKKYNGPVDKSEWGMTPQTVNAYYNPTANEIVFPAAILQAPFYDAGADLASNLGGIGMVMAHEVSHAFDSSGSLYDENGNYHVWWTKVDRAKFDQLAKQVEEYYSELEGFQGRKVNGAQTLNENIADLGSMACITTIASGEGSDLKLLFQQYATIWASKYTPEAMIDRLNTDPHSPAKVRVNGVLSATDAFYQTYPEIKEGDTMYIAPDKRVKIW
ncbi:M13 family metallopeptidase [Clostridium sp. E02]|uniref:M13 family metallopeptidase n=1 Tax=Clostridium sp. E02 TaxID=2487134 RepID=UPI000F51F838|nr:M13 family metallopeptidase [Clostridium sp. E02]